MRAAVREIVALAADVFAQSDLALAENVEPLEQVVERLRTGSCIIELGFVLSDLLTNLERVSDHCSNIAANVVEITRHGSPGTHEYMRQIHDGKTSRQYQKLYENYLHKYVIAYPVPQEGQTTFS